MSGERAPGYLERRGDTALWSALLAAPFAFLLHLSINFFMTDIACRNGVEWPLHVVTLLSLGLCAFGAASGLRLRRETGAHEIAEGLSRIERTRFLANVGLLAAGLFTLMVVAQWVGILVFHVCQRV